MFLWEVVVCSTTALHDSDEDIIGRHIYHLYHATSSFCAGQNWQKHLNQESQQIKESDARLLLLVFLPSWKVTSLWPQGVEYEQLHFLCSNFSSRSLIYAFLNSVSITCSSVLSIFISCPCPLLSFPLFLLTNIGDDSTLCAWHIAIISPCCNSYCSK